MSKEYKWSLLIALVLILLLIPMVKFNAKSNDEVAENKDEKVETKVQYEVPQGEKVVEVVAPKPIMNDGLEEIAKEEPKKEVVKKEEKIDSRSNLGNCNVSWYTNKCDGCSGITAKGVDVRNTNKYQGYTVAASDWNVIPPFSIIEVEKYGQFIIVDKGGSIKGNKLDLLAKTKKEAYSNGRQDLSVKVIRWGKGD